MSRTEFIALLIKSRCVACYPTAAILELEAQGFVEKRGTWWFPTVRVWQQ